MRVLKLVLVISVVNAILMTSCEKLEDEDDHPKSTINIRFKRQAPTETDIRIKKPVLKPTINLVKRLNVRPLVPGNQVKVLHPTIHNANNVIAKRPVLVINTPKSLTDSKNKTMENIKHNESHDHNIKVADAVAKNVEKEHEIKNMKKSTEKAHPKSEEKEHHQHIEKDKVECICDPNDESKIKLNEEITPPKLESRSMLKEDVKPLEPESNTKLEEDIHPKPEIKPDQISDDELKVVDKHEKKKSVKNKTKEKSDVKDLASKPTLIKTLNDVKKPLENKPTQEDFTPKIEIATTVQTNTVDDTDVNNIKTNVSQVPLVMTLDNSLKIEGGEELVISNNDYEELLENPSSYDTPKLIQTELRAPKTSTEFNDQNEYNQYLYDDQVTKYNQYIYNTYNGLKNKNNYGYQPQKGQWTYQARPGRLWRAWRNNQVFIRPKSSSAYVRPLAINLQSTPINSVHFPLTNAVRRLPSPTLRDYPYRSDQYKYSNLPNYNNVGSNQDVRPLLDKDLQSLPFNSMYLPLASIKDSLDVARPIPYQNDQYKYSNVPVPSYTFGSSQVNQYYPYYSQPSCSCGFHGY